MLSDRRRAEGSVSMRQRQDLPGDYCIAVLMARKVFGERFSRSTVAKLNEIAVELGLSHEQRVGIEIAILGCIKEELEITLH